MKQSNTLKYILALLISASSILAQTPLPEFIPITKGGNWGYCDSTKKMIIPFYNDTLIDTTNTKLNGYYSEVFPFSGSGSLGYVTIGIDFQDHEGNHYLEDKFFFINENNIPPTTSIDGDSAIVRWFSSVETIDYIGKKIVLKASNKYGLYDKLSNSIKLNSEYDNYYEKIKVFRVKKKGGYGLSDIFGKTLLECKYEMIYIDEYKKKIQIKLNGKYGYLNLDLTEKIPVIYDDLRETYTSGKLIAKKDGKVGIIDSAGKILVPFNYDSYTESYTSNYYILSEGEKYGCIDLKGNIIIPFDFENIKINEKDLAVVLKNEKWYLYNLKTGKQVLVPIQRFDFNYETTFLVVENEDLSADTLIDKNGTLITNKYQLFKEGDGIGYFYNDNYNSVKINGKSCLVRLDLTVFMEGEYDYYNYHFGIGYKEKNAGMDNLIMVKKNNKFGLIDTLKNILIPTDYDRLDYESKGLFKAEKSGKFGLINLKNKQLTSFEYDEITHFNNGFARVKKNGHFGFINQTGQEIIPCKYDKTDYQFINRLMKVTRDEKTFYIDDKGTEYFIEE